MRVNAKVSPAKKKSWANDGMRSKTHQKAFSKKPFQKNLLVQMDHSAVERKNKDLETTFAPPLTTSWTTPQLLNGLAQGIGSSERIGRRALFKSVQYRFIVAPADNGVSQNRILIVYDKQPNGALPGITDVLAVNAFYSPMNLSNSDRFVVISDEVTDSCQSSAMNMSHKMYKKCALETVFSATSGGVAAIASGSIFVIVANNSDPTVGQVSSSYGYFRLRYTDV